MPTYYLTWGYNSDDQSLGITMVFDNIPVRKGLRLAYIHALTLEEWKSKKWDWVHDALYQTWARRVPRSYF